MWDPCWTHVGLILDPCGTHAGPMWVSYWTHVGPILDPCGTHAGPMWDPYWTHVGPMLDPCGSHIGPMWDPYWTHVGPMLDPCGSHIGPMWDPYWTPSGFDLGQWRSTFMDSRRFSIHEQEEKEVWTNGPRSLCSSSPPSPSAVPAPGQRQQWKPQVGSVWVSGPRTWRRRCLRIPSESESSELFSSWDRKWWTFPRLSGFWLTSVPRRKTGPETACSRIRELKFAFQLYDRDRDGKISRTELLQVLREMLGLQVTEEQLQSIAERAIQEANLDRDDTICFDEFRKAGPVRLPERVPPPPSGGDVAGESEHQSQAERSLPGVKTLRRKISFTWDLLERLVPNESHLLLFQDEDSLVLEPFPPD
ncbi:uncharacterized protein LOC102237906 [Xiphophorus maculatus]|uniref:uncharacterized protein LOC102237906 n=1 Tax=Xiphophorus maculatus TaxID=8083 RepID=UPI000C6E4D91|nr:uncharacterized protein LOC102237906 [Xiphophorus maculatus]